MTKVLKQTLEYSKDEVARLEGQASNNANDDHNVNKMQTLVHRSADVLIISFLWLGVSARIVP